MRTAIYAIAILEATLMLSPGMLRNSGRIHYGVVRRNAPSDKSSSMSVPAQSPRFKAWGIFDPRRDTVAHYQYGILC